MADRNLASTAISTASDHVTGSTAGQLGQIGGSNVFEIQLQFAGELSHIPEHIPQLQTQILTDLGIEDASAITQHFLDLVGHFPRLTTEPQGGVDRIVAHLGIESRLTGSLLIGAEVHDKRGRVVAGW